MKKCMGGGWELMMMDGCMDEEMHERRMDG
jgi:hypothetical protein